MDKYTFVDDWFESLPEWLTKVLPAIVGLIGGIGYAATNHDATIDIVGFGALGLFLGLGFVNILMFGIKLVIQLAVIALAIGILYAAYRLYSIPAVHDFIASLVEHIFDFVVALLGQIFHLLGQVLDHMND